MKWNSHARILVVDDYDPFRRFVSSTLHRQSNVELIGQAQDGMEALRLAAELQPDLIVLDVGLPGMNGLEVARQISQFAPSAKIVFLTQESSPDVLREALDLGAAGYVIKAQAATDLLSALEAVADGKRFISNGLDGH